MNHSNNPAGRLFLLLTEGKKKPEDTNSRKIWAELLDVASDDTSLLLRRIAKVIDLPAQIREQIKEVREINHDTYLKGLPTIENVLSRIDFTKAWKYLKNSIDDTSLYSLEICSDLLSRAQPDILLQQEKLKVIHNDVRQLFDEVFESELDEELRKFILEHLKQIDQAIQEFKISGIKPLEVVFQAAIGDIIINPTISKSINKPEVWDRFWKIMGRIGVVLTISVNTLNLAEKVETLLPEVTTHEVIEYKTEPEASLPKETKIESEQGKTKNR